MERMSQRLAARMKSQFVGRTDELALVESLLRAGDQGAAVFVHGPGGVGKTTLLRRLAVLADEVGRHVVRVDGRDVPPIPAAFVAAIAAAAGVGDNAGIAAGQAGAVESTNGSAAGPDPIQALAELNGLVLLVDTAELLGPLDRWLREDLLPSLAADTVTILAGREPPSLEWRTDPGWRGLIHPLRLENLGAEDSRALLDQRGVPLEAQEKALEFTRGHPLALALVADVAENGRVDVVHGTNPAVVSALLGSLVDSVPSATHRVALEICAQVLTTTEPLLAALLGVEDAHEVFGWLRGLSIVETGPRGLFPHDLARDTLGSELRWRHPEQHADIHRRAGAYYREQFYLVDPSLQQQVLVEYVFLHRENPVLGPFVSSSAGSGLDLRSLVAVPVLPEDEESAHAAHDMVVGHEGKESGALLDHWMRRQPGSVQQVVGPDGDRLGLVAMLSLTEVTAEDRALDPAVAAVAAHLDALAPLDPGEAALLFRFWLTADGYQDLGPVQLFITLQLVRAYMATPGLAQSYVYYADPELWAPICAYSDMQRIAAADFTVGGRTYGVFGHDWRATPPLAWLKLLGEREISQEPLGRGCCRVPRCTAPALRVGAVAGGAVRGCGQGCAAGSRQGRRVARLRLARDGTRRPPYDGARRTGPRGCTARRDPGCRGKARGLTTRPASLPGAAPHLPQARPHPGRGGRAPRPADDDIPAPPLRGHRADHRDPARRGARQLTTT